MNKVKAITATLLFVVINFFAREVFRYLLVVLDGQYMMIMQSFYLVSLPISAYMCVKMFDNSYDLKVSKRMSLTLVVDCIFVIILSMPLIVLLSEINKGVDCIEFLDWCDNKKLTANNIHEYAVIMLVGGVLSPICEEYAFRGILQNWFGGKVSNIVGLIVVAMVFSFLHYDFLGMLPRFMLGLIIGLLYMITNNILYSIVFHSMNNLLSISLSYFVPKDSFPSNCEGFDIWIVGLSTLLLWLHLSLINNERESV